MTVQTWANQVWLEENAELYGERTMRPQSYPSCSVGSWRKLGLGEVAIPKEETPTGCLVSKGLSYIIWTQQGIYIYSEEKWPWYWMIVGRVILESLEWGKARKKWN